MSCFEDACPYDKRSRANRCGSCCASAKLLPPCVAAYLSGLEMNTTVEIVSIEAYRVNKARAA
jgi:hypothetical protein